MKVAKAEPTAKAEKGGIPGRSRGGITSGEEERGQAGHRSGMAELRPPSGDASVDDMASFLAIPNIKDPIGIY